VSLGARGEEVVLASRKKTPKTKPVLYSLADVQRIATSAIVAALQHAAAPVEPEEPAPSAAATRQARQTPPQRWEDRDLSYGGEWGSRHRF